ncbi:MAG TPA: hypothetical protein VM299_03415 [Solirubrobacteraceae bacterium]|nr:hypothetical protein [Solirubrobacteraceae bacterium]
MSGGLLAELYAQGAFNPALPQHELAAAHIPLGRLGISPAPERLLIDAVGQTDGLTLIVGASGAGKSSLMTYTAERLTELERDGRRYLPLLVPVAAHSAGAANLATFGRLAIASLLAALPVGADDRSRLERMTADNVTRQLPSKDFNARLALRGGLPGGVARAGADFGVTLRGEVLAISSPGALDHDPYGGLDELADMLRVLRRELVIMVEDTDAWAFEPDGGLETAQAFFAGVLAPLVSPGFSVVVAAQTRWSGLDAFSAISERAVARIDVPTYSLPRAREVITAIVAGRVSWTLGDRIDHSASEVLDDGALDVLAARLRDTGSVRSALSVLRDTLTKVSADFPPVLTREHLLESA